MSQMNVDVVRAVYADFSELAAGGDIATYVAAHYDPDCEYRPVEEADAIKGHDAMVSWNQRWFEAWDELRVEVEEVLEAKDAVVTAVRVEGRGGASGLDVSQRFFHAIELRDGKILRMQEFLDRDAALHAAGLPE